MLILSIAALLYYIPLLVIFPRTPEDLIFRQEPTKADLIVVLGGDISSRFKKAFQLAGNGYSSRIFCPSIRFPENNQLIEQLISENPDITFTAGTGSTSTFTDAIITKNYIYDKDIKTILLVTSDFHSFRASWIFNRILKQVNIVSVPVITRFSTDFIHNKKSCTHWAYRSEQEKFFLYYTMYNLY